MEAGKLLIVFVIMMSLLWRKAPLAPVMIGASGVLAVLYGANLMGFLNMAWDATKSPDTLELEAILGMIMILEQLLRQQGYLERMLNALTGLFRDRRTVMAILPAFIGLMPSAGGALFSAPLVEQAVGKSVTAEEKTFVNFYYRHIWEFFLPIYPGVLLASSITGIPLSKMILGLMPFGILMIIIGLPYLFSIKVNETEVSGTPSEGTAIASQTALNGAYTTNTAERNRLIKDIVFSTLPVVVVVVLVLASINVSLATTIVVGVLIVRHRYTPGKLLALVRKAVVVKTLVIIWAIMLFKEVMSSTGSFNELPLLLSKLPVPEYVVFAMISFLIAYLTGLTGNYVGIAFPIVVTAAGGQVGVPLAVFVFMAGSAGTMLSPMHLCLSLTIDYFKADLNNVLRKLIIPESILILTALAAFLILR